MVTTRKGAIILLTAITFLAGCTMLNGPGVQGEETESEGESLVITGPECNPATNPEGNCGSITGYDNIVLSLSVENQGSREVTVPFNDLLEEGFEAEDEAFNNINGAVLRSRCPRFFSMVESSVSIDKITSGGVATYTKDAGSETADWEDGFFDEVGSNWFFQESRHVLLQPGDQLDYRWVLKLRERDELAASFQCPISFRLRTDQTVSSVRRIQLKRDARVDDIDVSAVSSPGPMKLHIQAPDRWILGDLEEFPVDVYLENTGDGVPTDEVRLQETRGNIFDEELVDCRLEDESANAELDMLADNSGESERVRFLCTPQPLPDGQETDTAVMTMGASYGYTYELGTINVRICEEGGSC